MFALTDQPIIAAPPERHPHAGGIVIFEGRVRALNDGKIVTALEYETYPALALSEGETILAEAREKFAIFNARAIHRSGRLALGEMAVWVYTESMHRKDAFLANEYIIHHIKHRLPIWKKEWYASGASDWVHCTSHS
jgi:molybdopterin synthase catalytic subunit